MQLERKKNTIRNTIWGGVNRIISLLGPFVIRTIVIRVLGQEYLGLSSLFTSILQVLNLAELGFSSAIAYCMYGSIANNDNEMICALLSLFRKVYKFVGLIILALGIGLIPFLDLFIKADIPVDINIYYLYMLYLFNASISYLMYGYKSVLFSAFQREDVVSKIYSVLNVIKYFLQAVILLVFKDYYCYYLIVPLISMLNNVLIHILSKKIYPEFIPRGKVTETVYKNIKEKVSGVLISKFCGLTRNTFDSIIISSLLGLTAVAVYGNYYYLLSNVSAIMVIIVTSMRAGIGNSVALETKEKNYNDFKKFTFMYLWLASWCTICLLCLYQTFMELWVGKNSMLPFSLVILLCIYFWGLAVGDVIDAYTGAVGLWWENRLRTICEALSNLLLNFVLGYFWGLFGIVLATVITIFVFNFIWKLVILFKFYFSSYNILEYIYKIIFYAFVTVFAAVFMYMIAVFFEGNLVISLIYRGIVCCIFPHAFFLLFYHREKEYKEARFFILSLFNRKIRNK